ncbi:TonB-dependent receptor plug domain-containing protein [Gallaecimonas xiamenensis]|uniref:TonB dependent receptor n=1 Tax=Gallaecimonas xiamenensis 3-C-1 TaxID=745411 RepID=K2JLM4_9GAMM|nr:TonB-dependent receptor [Gallaecimonas xiamenensis]EKE76208.1 TonB dependent receptor [Gallaecimonas xiamenensis 3-C-1]
MTSDKNRKGQTLGLLSMAVMLGLGTLPARAEEEAALPDETEVISITGSRVAGRTAADSAAPIDIFDGVDIRGHSNSDLGEVVRKLVPSFNVPTQPISDGSSFVRPATLRGLPPDQTLVLVNGKRFHRSALVQLSGGSLAQGAQGPDISNIPSIALKRMEVLRDGASAQYGSDAIAGVINFVLRTDSDGLETMAQYGSTQEGDGDEWKVAANLGAALTEAGFINISAEITQRDETSRGVQRPDAQSYIDQGISGVPDPAMIWGTPSAKAKRLFWNAGLDLNATDQLYLFGNYSEATSEGSFYYRNRDRDFFTDIPLDGGGTFNFLQWFPGGFTPRFGSDNYDFSQVVGLKGSLDALAEDLSFDLSGSFGRDRIEYFMHNTINPSLGPDSPVSFLPGTLQQTEKNLNADFVYPIGRLNLAFGAEYRDETYEIIAGDKASWEIGPYSYLGIGSNGFPGFDPDQTGEWTRSNYAAYLDMEWDLTDQLMLGLAGRFEDFSDFGDTTNGKFSIRYNATDDLVLRGTVSTGFRAPTPGQSHTINVATTFIGDDPTPVAVGTIPPTNPIAQFFGGKALKPEESDNISVGLGWPLTSDLTATLDLYRIEVQDRVAMSGSIDIDDATRVQLVAAGIPRADDFGQIRFFTNSFDTRTQGIDLVVNYLLSSSLGDTVINLGANYNKTEVTDIKDSTIIDADRKADIENLLPKTRVNLNLTHSIDDLKFDLGLRYYGKWKNATDQQYQTYGAELIADASATWYAMEGLALTAGVENLFDNYPDKFQYGEGTGQVYPANSAVGTDGLRWFFKANYHF